MRRLLTGPAAILTVVFLIAGCTSSDNTAGETTSEPPATTVASAAAVAATATTTSEVTSATEGVSAEVEEEITALIDDWHTAINESDGQAALALFTVDGRYVSGGGFGTSLDGWAGEELEAQIEGQAGLDLVSIGSPLIIVRDNSKLGRPDSYRVAQVFSAFEYSSREHLVMYNIVDEEGTLKFRYVEDWAELGWFQLTEDSPYQIVGFGE